MFCGTFWSDSKAFFKARTPSKTTFCSLVSRLSHGTVPERLKSLSLCVNYSFWPQALQKKFCQKLQKVHVCFDKIQNSLVYQAKHSNMCREFWIESFESFSNVFRSCSNFFILFLKPSISYSISSTWWETKFSGSEHRERLTYICVAKPPASPW